MNSIYKSGNALIIKVSSEIYSKEAVSSTCYKYLKDYFINQLNNEQEKCIEVTLESKNSAEISDIVGKQFMNNLIDQQVRENVNKELKTQAVTGVEAEIPQPEEPKIVIPEVVMQLTNTPVPKLTDPF